MNYGCEQKRACRQVSRRYSVFRYFELTAVIAAERRLLEETDPHVQAAEDHNADNGH